VGSGASSRPGPVAVVEITGVRRSPAGETSLVELEAPGADGGLRLAQSGRDMALHGALFGDVPLVLVDGVRRHALVLGAVEASPLPAAPAVETFTAAAVEAALRPLIARLGGGLYSVEAHALGAPVVPGAAPVAGPCLLDPGALAPDDGAPIALDLGAGFQLLLGGRRALTRGASGLVLSGRFLLGGEGVEMRRHDLGAREGYARTWRHLLDERAMRDAVCAHQAAHGDVDLGRFSPDVLEPAAALARALLFDLGLLAGAPVIERPERITEGEEVAFVARVRAPDAEGLVQLILVTRDGATLAEARVRGGDRWETGLRPSPRALLKALHRVRGQGAQQERS
jgi:hypothetical protein